jgi:hypothetical protein
MVHAVYTGGVLFVMTSGDCTGPFYRTLRDLAARNKRTPMTLPRSNSACSGVRPPALAGKSTVQGLADLNCKNYYQHAVTKEIL